MVGLLPFEVGLFPCCRGLSALLVKPLYIVLSHCLTFMLFACVVLGVRGKQNLIRSIGREIEPCTPVRPRKFPEVRLLDFLVGLPLRQPDVESPLLLIRRVDRIPFPGKSIPPGEWNHIFHGLPPIFGHAFVAFLWPPFDMLQLRHMAIAYHIFL